MKQFSREFVTDKQTELLLNYNISIDCVGSVVIAYVLLCLSSRFDALPRMMSHAKLRGQNKILVNNTKEEER